MNTRKFTFVIFLLLALVPFSCLYADEGTRSITVSYSGAHHGDQTLTVNYADEWLLGDDSQYSHELARASFALAASGFRSRERDLDEKDHDILDFFAQAGFTDPRTDDYHVPTSEATIASGIASKTVGDTTLIAVSISGNNYGREWLSNLTLDEENRAEGFNNASEKVMNRLDDYILSHQLQGELRLWIAGFSRAAAVANITAADAVDSGKFAAVFAYTFATPRTTTDSNADKYENIFNILNPLDPVTQIPFPEWGYHRYGQDLYLPSLETDSNYIEKEYSADIESMSNLGTPLHVNPHNGIELHTLLDYFSFFISSVSSYKETFERGILKAWESKDFRTLLGDIWHQIRNTHAITLYHLSEFYNFLDYVSQMIYTDFLAQKTGKNNIFWDSSLSLQENMVYKHYDSTYRAWLFSDNTPEELYAESPNYAHYAITGDVDIEIFDEMGNFILQVTQTGELSVDTQDLDPEDEIEAADSDTIVYAERYGTRTLFVLPMDQTFTADIHSLKDQTIRVSFLLYSVDRLHADVRYIYEGELKKGETIEETLNTTTGNDYTEEEMREVGLVIRQPWSRNLVYSPTAVMRLENTGVFHPSPILLLLAIILVLVLIVWILVRIIRFTLKKIRNKK